MLKEIFTSVPKYTILHKERKKKETKYNTVDQVDIQAFNFVLMKHNYIFFGFGSQ